MSAGSAWALFLAEIAFLCVFGEAGIVIGFVVGIIVLAVLGREKPL